MTSPRKVYKPAGQEGQQRSEAPKADKGLIGLFGHTYIARNGERQLQYQIRVERALPPNRWLVQFYSFMDGCPNKLGVCSERYLLSENVALYPDAESWHAAYDEYSRSVR